jgi:hypothetical protein
VGRPGTGVLTAFSDGREPLSTSHLVRGDGRRLERVIEGRDALVDLVLVDKRYSCLLDGGLIVVDYPLIDRLAMFSGAMCGSTYPELIGLSFQHHL